MAEKDKASWTYVTTPKGRATFPSLFTPSRIELDGKPSGEPKYRVGILIPKKDLPSNESVYWKNMKALANKVAVEKFGEKLPANFRSPFIDGDIPTGERDEPAPGYGGHWVIRAVSGKKPRLVNVYGEPIVEESEIYGGMNIALNVNFFAYKVGGNTGVSMGFDRVIATGGGAPFEGDNRPDTEVFSDYMEKPDVSSDGPGDGTAF